MGSPLDYPAYNGLIESRIKNHGFWRSNIRGLHELLTVVHLKTPRDGDGGLQPLTKR